MAAKAGNVAHLAEIERKGHTAAVRGPIGRKRKAGKRSHVAARPSSASPRPARRASDDAADHAVTPAADSRARSSISRMFDILDLFSVDTPSRTVEDITASLGFTRSMAYRYVKELSDAGLIAPVGKANYALGPRIIELERQLHLSDPLLQAGLPAMRRLSDADPARVLLLCSLYRDKVLCIHHEGPEALLGTGKRIPIRRVRGLPFPLFVGAASLAILANLPAYQIRSLFLRYHGDIARAGLGDDWDAFRAALAKMRRAGFVVTSAQINPKLVAVAVPVIASNDDQVLGSLTLVAALESWSPAREREAVDALQTATRGIGDALAERSR